MEFFTPLPPEHVDGLAMALLAASQTPQILLDDKLKVIGASLSFCDAFGLKPDGIVGNGLASLGDGEWNVPQLTSLFTATVAGNAAIDCYEMDLVREGKPSARLVIKAHRLDYFDTDNIRLLVAVTDITSARLAEKIRDDLAREKVILMQELQHRVANSLQIIASVLLQSGRKVQSEEARKHIHNAHHRVMSIATLQKQLAASPAHEVELRGYFKDLCASIGASMIADPENLTLTATVDDTVTNADVSVSLGLIVTELVINSLKHAFPVPTKDGAITVDYASQGPSWTLSVGDNGIGAGNRASDWTPGLGTGIVDALSKQLDAKVVMTDQHPGTLISVSHKE